MKQHQESKGFTLVELLIVIAVISILTTVVFVALNPMARFQESRNARRSSDINSILGAIKLDQVDNGGSYLTELQAVATAMGSDNSSPVYQIGTPGSGCNTACPGAPESLQTACLNLQELVEGGYMPKMVFDPSMSTSQQGDGMTGYYIFLSNNGAVTIGACNSEKGMQETAPAINATR